MSALNQEERDLDAIDYELAEELVLSNDYDDILAAVDEHRLEIDDPLGGFGETLLYLAVHHGAYDLVVELLARRADVKITTTNDRTPLHETATNGNVMIAELLLRAGAELDAKDREGSTSVMCAVNAKQQAMLRFLLEAGADTSIADGDGNTPSSKNFEQAHIPMQMELAAYHMPPRVKADEHLTREALLEPDEHGLCALDANVTWYRFADYAKALQANGETLEKEDVQRIGKKGISYLERGTMCGEFPELYALIQSEPFVAEDLLDAKGTPNGFTQRLAEQNQLALIFTEENWVGQEPNELRQVLAALPADVKAQIRNAHTLGAEVSRQHRQAQRANEGAEL